MLLDRFRGHLRVEAGLRPRSVEAYAWDILLLLDFLAKRRITSIRDASSRHIADHIASLKSERHMQASSVTRHLAAIRVFFRWAFMTGLCPSDPTEPLQRPVRRRRLPDVVSPAKARAMLEVPAPSHEKPEDVPMYLRDRALLELLYSGGLRASEAADIRTSDVLDSKGLLRVTGKGGKARLVPLGKPAWDAVRRYLTDCRPRLIRPEGGHDGRLLLSCRGRPLERVAIYQIVRKAARRAGLRGVHPHTLRHSYATHMLIGGADLRVVQELLGHANISTTQIYTHVDRSRLREVHKKCHPRERRPA
jgi:integrase/recombinase XerD